MSGSRRAMGTWLVVGVAALSLVALTLVALKVWAHVAADPVVAYDLEPRKDAGNRRLVALVHGAGGPERFEALIKALRKSEPDRDVLIVRYPGVVSNADPVEVARNIGRAIADARKKRTYEEVVLVGSSMGALLARKAYLLDRASGASGWSRAVERIVLLAGMNRGFDFTGHRPSDMGRLRQLLWGGSVWIAQVLRIGGFVREVEAGAPFVANLRMEWLERFRGRDAVEVVQLHGDIDDLVTEEDNKDLEAAGQGRFVWMLVRGTNHRQILDLHEPELGPYRQDKILRAITADFEDLRRENEELPSATDPEVKHVVFVVHGIRDLGRWSSSFEQVLRRRHLEQGGRGKLAVVSSRYGYFGMGPFLLPVARDKYVRWLMDEITEARARYPEAERFDFVGHSNGTYLLAKALERYASLKMDRLVFAGSVVRRDYNWYRIFSREQVKAVRNYTASADWVVALFPRLFELRFLRWLKNDIGSAGFNGFTLPGVENVGPIKGPHGAFRDHVDWVADFLLPEPGFEPPDPVATSPGLKFVSDWLCWAVWLVIVGGLLWIGFYLVGSAKQLYPVVAVGYAILLILLLRKL